MQSKAKQYRHTLGILTLIGVSSGLAAAQNADPHFFAESRIIVGDWTFVPIFHTDVQQVMVVDGLFVYADEATRTGNNLSAVWYDKEPDGWYASSWETVDLQEAIKSVTIAENIQNTLWDEFMSPPFEGTPENPKGFSDGVLIGDPVENTVANAVDPQPLVDFLVTVGYAAADVPVVGDQGCNREEILNDLAFQSAVYISAGDWTTAYRNTSLCQALGIPAGPNPAPVPPTPPANAPPHVDIPINGPLPGTGWIPGGWPTFGTPPANDWSCGVVGRAATGYTCRCSRKQRWGRWESKPSGNIVWCVVEETEVCESETSSTPPATCNRATPPTHTCGSTYN